MIAEVASQCANADPPRSADVSLARTVRIGKGKAPVTSGNRERSAKLNLTDKLWTDGITQARASGNPCDR